LDDLAVVESDGKDGEDPMESAFPLESPFGEQRVQQLRNLGDHIWVLVVQK